jgi:cytochrome c oxidase accessory protein FixG
LLSARPVRGFFRRLRWWTDWILIAILFAIPWIHIDGEPLILLDIPARQFHVFGLVIFPQELFFLWLILAALALALFFFTALFGRLWCGWACPQTVFTDLFAAVARRIQGWKGNQVPRRIAVWRKLATHAVWILLSLVIGFHLVSYFHSPYDLISQALRNGTIYPTVLGFHLVAAAVAYFDFVFLKQTFCKYLCPYARFQGVLFDRDTLVIGYDGKRGEPRGKRGSTTGDCVDCNLCVAVCPTGIDIRNGLQLECIACTQCIDACNGVMARLGRDTNLIGYRSLVGLEGSREIRLLRPRVLVYGAMLAVVAVTFVTLVGRRLPMDLHVAHNRSALSSTAADGRVGNAFTLHIQNRDREEHRFRLRLEDPSGFDLVAGVNPISVAAASAVETRVFVLAADAGVAPSAAREIRFVLEREDDTSERVVRAARFLSLESTGGG